MAYSFKILVAIYCDNLDTLQDNDFQSENINPIKKNPYIIVRVQY